MANKSVKQILITGPPGIGKTTLVRKICDGISRDFPTLKLAGFFTQETRDATSKQRTGFEIVKLPESANKRATLAAMAPPFVVGKKLQTVGKYTVRIDDFESIAMDSMKGMFHILLRAIVLLMLLPATYYVTFAWKVASLERAREEVSGGRAMATVRSVAITLPSEISSRALTSEASYPEADECSILVLDELGKMESFSADFCRAVADWLKKEERAFLLATVPIAKGKPLRIVEEVQRVEGSVTITLNRENRDKMCDEVKKLIADTIQKM